MQQPSDWLYTEKVKEHFINPRNILMDEDGFDFDGKGIVGDIKCGDQMAMWIKVEDDRISDCRWKTYGCASAIASTSMLSEMVRGMTLDEAFDITPKAITAQLGGLPEHKIHCSVLGDKALRAAINDYYRSHGMPDRVREEKARVVCACIAVTDKEIEECVLDGARTYLELQDRTKIGTVCGKCRPQAERLLEEYAKKHFSD